MISLPSVQLDFVEEDAAEGVDSLVANRNPQPGELQIPLRAPVIFDHITAVGARPALDSFVVTIAGVIIYEDAALQHGWTGVVTEGDPNSATVRFLLFPPTDYPQGMQVNVVVTTGAFQATWKFTAYDLASPIVTEAVAVGVDRVVVTFSEPVAMEDASAQHDALNPNNYVIERSSRPAATPTVRRVERVSDVAVALELSFEMTFGANYLLVVSDVSDEYENVILPPLNVATFRGFLPPFPGGRRFLLADFLPRVALGADTTEELRLFIACLQDVTNLKLYEIDRWTEILDPDLAPEPFIDAMLLDLGNPFVDFDLDLTNKRKLVKLLVRIYGLKGTAVGIVDVVRFFLGIEIEIEVFNTGAGWKIGRDRLSASDAVASQNPAVIGPGQKSIYSFRILTESVLTEAQRASILKLAAWMKGPHEHLIGIKDTTAVAEYRYWKFGFTRLNHARLHH